MSCTASPTPFRARFMLSKAHGNFKHTPQCAYKGSKKKVILSNSTRKKMRFKKISSQKFGINENTSYLCNVKGEIR
jgi:hypothetical protein